MSGYSGNTSFEYEIERCKDKDSGKYLPLDKANDDFEYEYVTLTLNIEGSSYFTPGKLFGPPENCWPDDGETEITSVIGPDGKDWEDQLTKEERESILVMIEENVCEDGPEPDDDYDDC